MRRFRQLAELFTALLLAGTCFASQIAILKNGFSIPHERRVVVGTMTRLYTGSDSASYVDVPTDDIDHFEIDNTPVIKPPAANTTSAPPPASTPAKPAPRAAINIDQIVGQASDAHQIDPDFINSVIRAESGFNVRAVSPKGAQGLMQLMPQTAGNLGVSNAFDPRSNVEGGTRYLRYLLEKYNYDVVKALAAYNAGPKRVDQYHGIPPYYETQAYVARIIRDYNRKKLAEQKALQAQSKSTSRTMPTRTTATRKARPQARPPATTSSTSASAR